MTKAIRQSNFELLRIVAIFMIICHHLAIKSACTCGYTEQWTPDTNNAIGLITNSLVVGGVNMFLLISGWFGVKHILPQVIRLILDCFVYAFITNLFCVFVLGYQPSLHEFFFSCDFRNNWFVLSFVIFLMVAPIIERGLQNIDQKTCGRFVLLLTIVNILFGYLFHILNVNGYNALNFVYIYVIGRYLKCLCANERFSKLAIYGFVLWLMSGVVLTLGYIFYSGHSQWAAEKTIRFFGYNNPFVITSAVGLFLTFSTLKIQNKYINLVAKTVFGVFLLHTTSLFIQFRTTTIRELYLQHGYLALLLVAILLFVICTLISLIVEKVKAPIYDFIITGCCRIKNYI